MIQDSVHPNLKKWFVVHFIIDLLVAIPLFFFPESFLGLLGWVTVDNLMARIIGAAFFGIGIESFLGRNGTVQMYRGMLNLKIIWSAMAIIGIGWSMLEGSQGNIQWLTIMLVTFIVFNINWIYWRVKLKDTPSRP